MATKIWRYAGLIVFGMLAIIALAATLMPIWQSEQWYVRVWDYPRLQTFCIAVAAVAWYLFFYFKRGRQGYVFVAMFLAVIMIQGYKALPYTIVGKKQVLNADAVAIDSSNISMLICNVLQTNDAYDKVVDLVNDYSPDIFITTESDTVWQNKLQTIEAAFPYRVPVPQSNTYGMHLYSRLPLRNTSVRYLIENDIPSIRTEVQLPSGQWIHLFVVHPRPPAPTEAPDSKARDAEIILVGKEASKEKGGVIVAGDFNDVAWSRTTKLFQEVTGFLDPRRGRGFYNTFHAKIPIFRWPLDHIFHSNHFNLVEMKRTHKVESDHFPMFVRLRYNPSEKNEQPAVKPDEDTEKEADKAVEEGN
jgi:endonuclease/exonuclease/phosphatase (EEP) superfamily protein YafD